MEGYTVDKYLSSLVAQKLSIRGSSSLELKSVFKKILVSTDDERPLCMVYTGTLKYMPLIMPTYLVSKRNLRSILKYPFFFCSYRWAGLELAGIRTKNDIFYIGKNLICDADGTPLFVPTLKYINGRVECFNVYIHSRVTEQNTYISRVIFKQFIPVLAVKEFNMYNFGPFNGSNMKKANIIINDISKFYKIPKLHSMSSILTTDFGALVANNL